MALTVRALTTEEERQVRQLAHARTVAARGGERARIVWLAQQGKRVPAIAAELGLCPKTVRLWLTRFNAAGLAGLTDAPRPGGPPTYTETQRSTLIATVLSKPAELGLPFACWTLDRLVAYLGEQKALALKRSRAAEILRAEGVRWRTQETWFGARVDPACAEKRGQSSSSTPLPQPTASSSA